MKNSRSKNNLLTQAAMPSVLASTCFNSSNNRFSSKFTNPVSSPRTRGSSSATSASQFLHKPSFEEVLYAREPRSGFFSNLESAFSSTLCDPIFSTSTSASSSSNPPNSGFFPNQIWHFSSLAPDSGYVVLGRESEIELRNPTRKRSRRNLEREEKSKEIEKEKQCWGRVKRKGRIRKKKVNFENDFN
ncbi:hypothetical protein SLEP1_g48611 [Rubroshorea leprosula]|uniref:Uncharacterized protein n=1 Tax=Rubroshorea leprosula TaxID=152421 RepID=A0AAV5HJV5_9ROSI|nr:hypothetical protein SLEP1_g1505 [Rubroshorea leprosula]GKV41030.1 hypothetical protein SLEP1_g48611 [Rubroshorea leprosula]